MRFRFHAEARAELLAAAEWYARERVDLGEELLAELARALDAVRADPRAWPVVAQESGLSLRRIVLARFPYGVIYATAGTDVFVVAVAHEKRRPGYWRGRVRG